MKRYNSNYIIFVSLAVLLVLVAVFLITSSPAGKEKTETATQQEMRLSYEFQLKSVLGVFVSQNYELSDKKDRLTLVQQTKEEILKFTVPTRYKDLHLALVLALSELEQGLNGNDEDRVTAGMLMFNELAQDQTWLDSLTLQ